MSRHKKPIALKDFLEKHRDEAWSEEQNEFDQFSQKAIEGLQYHSKDEPLNNTLNRLRHQIGKQHRPNKQFPIRRLMSIAAGFMILVAGIYFLYLQTPDNEALFSEHFSHIPMVVDDQARSRTNNQPENASLEMAAISAYEEKDFLQAEGLLRVYLEEHPADIEKAFYYGIIQLGKGNTNVAIPLFKQMLSAGNKDNFKRPANWYLGLAYLKQGAIEDAQYHFEQIAQGEDRYAMSARALLKGMQ
ncbi:MAG: hypothetical protein MI974_23230 [Chitinophagales bacterium]|nr:hypothetical protein [Chitinophagales bacterium]